MRSAAVAAKAKGCIDPSVLDRIAVCSTASAANPRRKAGARGRPGRGGGRRGDIADDEDTDLDDEAEVEIEVEIDPEDGKSSRNGEPDAAASQAGDSLCSRASGHTPAWIRKASRLSAMVASTSASVGNAPVASWNTPAAIDSNFKHAATTPL